MENIVQLKSLLDEDRVGIRLLLVRHGETDWNCQQRFQGQIDVPLNRVGQWQAERIAELFKRVPIDLAFSSPLVRAKETSKIILNYHPGISLELRDNLKEIGHGIWEGKSHTDVYQQYFAEFQRWLQAPTEARNQGGENLQEVQQRVIKGWRQILEYACSLSTPSKNILIVTHDGICKVILCNLSGKKLHQFWDFKQDNGAINIIDYPESVNGIVLLRAININLHLVSENL